MKDRRRHALIQLACRGATRGERNAARNALGWLEATGLRFSYSSIRKWFQCERAWSFAYVDRLVPLRSRTIFDLGKYVHALFDHALLGHARTGVAAVLNERAASDICRQLKRDENLELEETDALAGLEAARGALVSMKLDQWETLTLPDGRPAVELAIKTPWRGHELDARIDWIAKSKATGKTYVVDHKTTRSSIDDADPFMEMNIQAALYSEAAKSVGIEVDGCLHNLVRVPKTIEPAELKSGKLSRDKNKSAMPWPLYKRALLERGLDPAEYEDMREALEARTWQMWRPDVTSDNARAVLLSQVEIAIQRMEVSLEDGHYLTARVPEQPCMSCEFRKLCDQKLDGQDIRPLLNVAYKARDEASPWFDQENFDDDGLVDFFARTSRTGRFDTTDFVP